MEDSRWGEPQGEESECRSCGAPVQWVLTRNGKRMPVDPDTDESHFKTCPDAGDWSRKGKASTDATAPATDRVQAQISWIVESLKRIEGKLDRMMGAPVSIKPSVDEEIPF